MITNLCAMEAKTYFLIFACVAVAAVIVAIIAVIISHKKNKKPTDDTVMDSRDKLNDNVQAIEPLLVLADGKAEITEQLESLQDKLKYLSPSTEKEVAAIDKKIGNALGDIKIELSKTKNDAKFGKAQKYIEEIELLIAERSAYTER